MSEADTGQIESSLKKLLLSRRNGIRPEHDDEVVSREDGRKSQVISSKDQLTASLTPSSPASIKETGDIKLDLDQNGKSLEAARSSNGRIQDATGPDDHNKVSLLLLKRRRSLQSRFSEESLRIKSLSTSRAGSNSIASKSANNVADRTHITEDKIKPLAAQAHRGASFGKVIASHSSHQSLPTANYNLNPILLIGLPLLGCLILALIIYLVARYRRRLKQKNADKCHGSNDVGGGSATKSRSPLTNFITNGNLLGASTKPNLIKRANELSQKKAPDCNQLTINMDGDCRSDRLAAEDSLDLKFKNFMRHKQTNNIKLLGSLRYRLSYDFNQSILSVSILEACDLPGMDLNGYSDPYVKVYLSPNKSLPAGASALRVDNQQTQNSDSVCYRTRIHKRTLNPVFNETFKFHLAYAELANKTLIMSMYDFDRFSKHDDMGQVSVAMDQIDLAQGQDEWAELRKINEQLEERLGDICLSLRYVPSSGKLNVVILQARQLKRMDVAGLSDPYVKLALMSDQGKRLKKKKTSIKKFTLNPHYNESFSFEIPFDQIQQVQLVVSVVDYDRIGTSEPIGKITLGCGQPEGSTELRHWMDMLASPRRPIAQWHTLKDINLDGRTSSSSGSIGSATS